MSMTPRSVFHRTRQFYLKNETRVETICAELEDEIGYTDVLYEVQKT